MKRVIVFFLPVILCFSTVNSSAQLRGIGKRIKQKVNERIDRRFDQAVDKALDETEGEIIDAASGDGQPEASPENQNAPTETAPASAGTDNAVVASTAAGSASFAVNTKFDYVPGEQVMVFEDFEQDAVGDFPARWNTNGTGEVVTLGNPMKSGS